MADVTKSPSIAIRAGNRTEMTVAKQLDPIYLAKIRWNQDLVLAGEKPAGSEAPRDGAPYTVAGSPQPFCWPHLRVAWREGFLPGPQVRFQQKEDGMHLTVVFEEDPSKRAPGALPFDVKITSLRLVYGSDASDFLEFPEPLPEPKDATKGPAFTIEADALVPLDERRARIVSALQTQDAARWTGTMAFEWIQTIPPPTPAPPAPPTGVHIVGGQIPRRRLDRVMVAARPQVMIAREAVTPVRTATAVATPTNFALVNRPELLRAILTSPPPPQPTTRVQTIAFTRTLKAEYPNNTPENRPVFAAVTGDYAQVGWKNTAHGWFQPTPIQDTVYTLPHAYRLHVDEATGQPSIQAILLRKGESGTLTDSLDPKFYTVRLTLRVRPDFDAEKLNALRALIRAQSSNTVGFADLVLGGYGGARFVPDPALAGLGELFAGSTAGVRDAINPEEGFTLTYEGNAEFIDLLFQRLKGQGIEGTVELDLQEPGGTVRKQPVPVQLTLRGLGAVSLPWTFATPAASDMPDSPAGAAAIPQEITLRNPMATAVTLGGIQANALQKSAVTGHVDEWYHAVPDGAWPRTLGPNASVTVRLAVEGDKPLYNAWDLLLVDCHTTTSAELVLGGIFDAATSGVRGWQVAIDCPPLAFFDQLTPEDQARMRDVVAIEIEVRRKASPVIEEVRLTRQAASGVVLLSRTVADFVSDRSVGRSTFEYRQRALRLTRADDWTDWREETGSALSVFLA
jgi:hypothetical protein